LRSFTEAPSANPSTTSSQSFSSLLSMSTIGKVLLVPQLLLLLLSSLLIAPNHLSLALFIQTYIFVILNKVITAQYFTWYLCLLPLCCTSFRFTKRIGIAFILLLLSIGIWLGTAYCLEMQGWAVHIYVWIASVLYFLTNVYMLSSLLSSTRERRPTAKNRKEKDA
jgi:GPI mannosyltransferase 1 subunit M